MQDYRDVHGSKAQVAKLMERVNRSDMSQAQKEMIVRFVRDLKIGRAGKKVQERRIANYLQFLFKLHAYFRKDLTDVSAEDATQFYLDLEEDKIRKANNMPYAQASKDEWVKTLKRYLGWAWKGRDNPRYKEVAAWMKESYRGARKNAITLPTAKQIVEKEPSVRNRCLFMFLFDSGARIEEALNVRVKDLTRSSDNKYFMVFIRGTKTELAERTISVPVATAELNAWLEEHPTGHGDDYLFPIRYDNARKIIKIMSERETGDRLKPHELRHSSATHYVQVFGADNISGFYYRYGWKFGSKEANTYIKTYLFGGEIGQRKVVQAVDAGRVTELEKELNALRRAHAELQEAHHEVNKRLLDLEEGRGLLTHIAKVLSRPSEHGTESAIAKASIGDILTGLNMTELGVKHD